MKMRSSVTTFSLMLILAGCSGSGGEADGQFDDIETGARLLRERPLAGADAAERATRLAECAGTLISAAAQTPPLPRSERMLDTATRLHGLAIQVGGTGGLAEADVTRIRDEAVAATNQFVRNSPATAAPALAQGADKCGMAEAMTDEELTQ